MTPTTTEIKPLNVWRDVSQVINDTRELIHYLLFDTSVTTAMTMLTTDHMPTDMLAEIWQELVAMDDAMVRLDIAELARRLRRRDVEPGRELRSIEATDCGMTPNYWRFAASEIRRHSLQSRACRQALATLDSAGYLWGGRDEQ